MRGTKAETLTNAQVLQDSFLRLGPYTHPASKIPRFHLVSACGYSYINNIYALYFNSDIVIHLTSKYTICTFLKMNCLSEAASNEAAQ